MKKAIALTLATAMSASLLADCGGSQNGGSQTAEGAESSLPAYNELTVGTDYTDLKADLKFISHRTDLVDDGTFAGYVAEFQKMYPNITISYEGITDYANDMTTRLTSNDWGDICMIPTTIPLPELSDYFYAMCDLSAIENDYNFADNRAYNGKVYGIPSTGNAQGIVYNKAVFEAAGITELPKTPTEFLDALQKIKDYDSSIIPLYTNYAAGWTMSAWDAYIGGGATADADWMNVTMPQTHDAFAKGVPTGDEESGPYAVYNILYEAVKCGLTESDPTTTDWEGSKPLMNHGQIATMVLGSWAIIQMQDAGPNADDIGYMPFPISVDGVQYASAGADYGVFCSESKDTTNPDLSAAVAAAGIVRTKDLKTWERLPNLVTKRSPQQRNVDLLPEFVNGKYAFYTRPMDDFIDTGSGGGIGFGLCEDITHAVIDEEIITSPRRYHTITEAKNGEGATPIKTEKGWLHIAHGVRNTAAGLRYVVYLFVTDLKEPWKVIAEPSGFLIAPRDWERVGDVSNVVFTNGAIAREDGSVYIYYAASDTRLHVATTTIDKLLDFAFNTPADPLRSRDCVAQRCELIEKNLAYLKEGK